MAPTVALLDLSVCAGRTSAAASPAASGDLDARELLGAIGHVRVDQVADEADVALDRLAQLFEDAVRGSITWVTLRRSERAIGATGFAPGRPRAPPADRLAQM